MLWWCSISSILLTTLELLQAPGLGFYFFIPDTCNFKLFNYVWMPSCCVEARLENRSHWFFFSAFFRWTTSSSGTFRAHDCYFALRPAGQMQITPAQRVQLISRNPMVCSLDGFNRLRSIADDSVKQSFTDFGGVIYDQYSSKSPLCLYISDELALSALGCDCIRVGRGACG